MTPAFSSRIRFWWLTVLTLLTGLSAAPASEGAVSGPDATLGENLSGFFRYGVEHVLTGWDHLLFAAALVLALRSFWEVFKVIGVFTLAHSITVALVAFKVFAPAPEIIEPIIAGSIIVVALENILFPGSAVTRRRLLIAFGFGLVHGMGLANALAEGMTGLPGAMVGWAVAAFCVGVEIGHLIIVAPLSGILKIGRDIGKERFQAGAMRYGSALVALGGFYYLAASLGWLGEG